MRPSSFSLSSVFARRFAWSGLLAAMCGCGGALDVGSNDEPAPALTAQPTVLSELSFAPGFEPRLLAISDDALFVAGSEGSLTDPDPTHRKAVVIRRPFAGNGADRIWEGPGYIDALVWWEGRAVWSVHEGDARVLSFDMRRGGLDVLDATRETGDDVVTERVTQVQGDRGALYWVVSRTGGGARVVRLANAAGARAETRISTDDGDATLFDDDDGTAVRVLSGDGAPSARATQVLRLGATTNEEHARLDDGVPNIYRFGPQLGYFARRGARYVGIWNMNSAQSPLIAWEPAAAVSSASMPRILDASPLAPPVTRGRQVYWVPSSDQGSIRTWSIDASLASSQSAQEAVDERLRENGRRIAALAVSDTTLAWISVAAFARDPTRYRLMIARP